MTYGIFLAFFLVAPVLASFGILRQRLAWRGYWAFVPLMVVVYAGTSWWDNVAVMRGYWSFASDKIWGIHWAHLPVEEYLFFGLQTLLTGTWVGHRLFSVLTPDAR